MFKLKQKRNHLTAVSSTVVWWFNSFAFYLTMLENSVIDDANQRLIMSLLEALHERTISIS